MEFKAPSNNESGKKTAGLDERIGSLFQPDTLIGEDYASNFRRKIPLEAERTLLLAILEDGIRSFQENLFATSGKRRTIFDEANEWIFSDEDSWFCSFVSICNLLNLEPQYIRRGLRQWEDKMHNGAVHKKSLSVTGDEQRLVA
ncbi:MAG TPA: hypothetical protein VMZ02_09935 [Candidatus Limnocylindrales bacterium]|nr:hypothetical protein [Candidatus Limnocylindrales bacterium]